MKVAIVGYGVEGASSYNYWKQLGCDITIVDEASELANLPKEAKVKLGPGAFDGLNDFDLIVRSPGVHPGKLPYGNRVWSLTNEFIREIKQKGNPIIGVTGTKGKGTTSSLIALILHSAGYRLHLVGNIGVPALDILEDVAKEDIIVYELSSFQLWDLKEKPDTALILGVEADHLDAHSNLEDYIRAKTNILDGPTTDQVVYYNGANKLSTQIASKASNRAYDFFEITAVEEGYFYCHSLKLCSVKSLNIVGPHNIDNARAAIATCWPWLKYHKDIPGIVERGLSNFKGLAHRLRFVAERNDIKYYDDSIATTPGSAIAAIKSFSEPKVIILGGSDKGADYRKLIELCKKTDTKVVAIGALGDKLKTLCDDLNVESVRVEGLMDEVVSVAASLAVPGGVVILSPAGASFDQYENYVDRGQQFIERVNEIVR